MGFMSRDCRKVVNELEKLSGKKCTMQDIFDGEQLVYTYYAKTICRHINRFYNPDSKGNPNAIAFYVKPTKSINKGKRTTDIWEMTENDKEIYSLITNGYLIEDFSIDQLKIIKDMGKFDIRDIKVGIQEAKRENIFSIHYLFRIVEGIVAKKEHMKANRQRIKELYSYNDNDDTISRNQIELAQMKYSWKNTLENIILEKKVRELYKNE
jgi:hypothetical protein